MKRTELKSRIESRNARSAWDKGVQLYALEIVDGIDDRLGDELPDGMGYDELLKLALGGADSWAAYSFGACSLIYDEDIAARLLPPSRFARRSRSENWLEVQASALRQAFRVVYRAYR